MTILAIIGGLTVILWGIAHLFPTKSVVKEFGSITLDNQRILTMEWANEGLTLIFLGILTIAVSIIGDSGNGVVRLVHILTSLMLIAMAVLSLNTGFKVKFLPYRLCPFIFSLSAILIFISTF